MFFGVKRERESCSFLLSEGLVKMSDDDVFRGMHPKKSLCPSKTNKTRKKSKTSLSSLSVSFPLLFSFLSFLSFPHNKKLLPFLGVALVFILSARRTSHLSEHSLESTHHRARRHPLCCSAFLQYYKECFERKEREKRACCLWL